MLLRRLINPRSSLPRFFHTKLKLATPVVPVSTTMITRRLMHDEKANKNLFQLNSISKHIRNKYLYHVNDFFNPSIFAFAMLSLAGTIAFLYMVRDYLSPRETEIVHETIDLK